MARVNSRASLITYCKRQLGWPVVQINVDDDQVSDRIDEAIQYGRDYNHYDLTEETFLKYKITQTDINNRYIDITRASGTVDVTANNAHVWGSGTVFTEDMKNGNAIIRINNETRQVASVTNTSHMTVNTAFTATATAQNIYVPKTDDTIISISRILIPGMYGGNRDGLFDVQYQFALNEMYDLAAISYVNYFITMTHLRNIQLMFNGEKEIRFNRSSNRLYLDFNLNTINSQYIIAECLRAIDPDAYPETYNDRWLKKYSTALLKRQWGTNMKKFSGVALIGGVQMNGQAIYEEALKEIEDAEDELKNALSRPPMFIVG